jgi:ComF family protein
MSAPWSNLTSFGRLVLGGVTNLVFPNTCWHCGDVMPPEQEHLCARCFPALTVDPYFTCPRCSSSIGPHLVLPDGCPECRDHSFAFDGVFRMGPYDGVLRDVILRMKKWTGEDLAEVIAGIWARKMVDRLRLLSPDLVVPIPLHWKRRWQRGFNSCDLLAQALARALVVPYRPLVLRRARATPQQTLQPSATARRENVKHAFEARTAGDVQGKTVLLIDDVLTTGATASEAAKALRVQKPKGIYVVVMAHSH